jgi:hypothetical protein
LKWNGARIPAYVDSAYFLVFNRILQRIANGAGETNVTDISAGSADGVGDHDLNTFLLRADPAELTTAGL